MRTGTAPSVLRVITRLNIGGPARHVGYLTRALPAHWFRTALVSGSETPGEGRIEPGVPYTTIPELQREVSPVRDVIALRRLRAIVRRSQPAIVHTHLAKAGLLGRVAAGSGPSPIRIHTFHGHVLDGYFGMAASTTFLGIERALAHRCSALIAVSEAVRDELYDLGIGRADQWHVVPVGLELNHLLGDPPARDRARAVLGLPASGSVVGIVGRLVPIKDHETFIAMAALVGQASPDVTFAIIGDGERRRALEVAVPPALRDRIVFTGWQTDLASVYAALDVVVLTSLNEGTPVALIEAAAAGRPVVATDVGGVRDVVRHGETGALVPAGNAAATSMEVLRIVRDEALAREWGMAGRRWVRSRFAANRLASDTARLYRELLERGPMERGRASVFRWGAGTSPR
jgi:glycosyltransferase involved in cell wall biosynthesis